METKNGTQKILAALLFLAMQGTALESFAMSKKKPAPAPTQPAPKPTPPPVSTPTPTPPAPAPEPTPPRDPAGVVDPVIPNGYNVFREVSYPVGSTVDNYYKSYRELIPQRNAQEAYKTDLCDPELDRNDRFADRVAYAVEVKMQPSRAQLGYVASYFNLNKDVNTYMPNSLISHPLCNVTASTLNTTLNGKKVPSADVIRKVNLFADTMNEYRRQALAGQAEGYVKASKLWSKYMMCLSYGESLTTADTTKSNSVAAKYAPSGYRKPAGVKFYEDPLQPQASKLNIGLFQFTPDAGGNIQACIREWNLLYPSCKISQTASAAEMIRVVGSSLQTFNAFCGAAKVTGMFAVQVNATSATNTHPYNVNSSGSLKAPAQRCVTPHMATGKTYNHFGPFQNSTGENLNQVLTCVFNGDY
ncbi:hypothetical protein BDW_02230 [Bdellovibrio bacteriovorus W]|nr:hypothetical protein BDW_02230 [Bdellovibrio bacteriovorus W]